MSQKKVEAYKEYKKNKDKYLKKEKLLKRVEIIAAAVVGALLIAWIGFSILSANKSSSSSSASTVDTTVVSFSDAIGYLNDLKLDYSVEDEA